MTWESVSLIGAREVNEDHVRIIENGDTKCFVVADGLGGHGKGDIASMLACDAFENVFSGATSAASLSELLTSAFLQAQSTILEQQSATGNHFQMKTTACVLAIRDSEAVWGHIGDTRLYAFSHNRVKLRTLDHSVPQMLVLTKEIKEKDIRNHPDRNKLLRVLGVSGDVPKFELSATQNPRKYQAFLLCSDGFWELINEKEVEALLKKSKSPDEWMQKMCEIITQRGSTIDMDNSSAIAVWV